MRCHVADGSGKDVFVHISAVERAGWITLNEGQKVSFEVVANRRTGKSSAENLNGVQQVDWAGLAPALLPHLPAADSFGFQQHP
jgi:CspA family cold shock protein